MPGKIKIVVKLDEKEHGRLKGACVRLRRSWTKWVNAAVAKCVQEIEEEEIRVNLRRGIKLDQRGLSRLVTDKELDGFLDA